MKQSGIWAILAIGLGAGTLCSSPSPPIVTSSGNQYNYGIISQYEDHVGNICLSSFLPNDSFTGVEPNKVIDLNEHKKNTVNLLITKVTRHVSKFDFEDMYEEL